VKKALPLFALLLALSCQTQGGLSPLFYSSIASLDYSLYSKDTVIMEVYVYFDSPEFASITEFSYDEQGLLKQKTEYNLYPEAGSWILAKSIINQANYTWENQRLQLITFFDDHQESYSWSDDKGVTHIGARFGDQNSFLPDLLITFTYDENGRYHSSEYTENGGTGFKGYYFYEYEEDRLVKIVEKAEEEGETTQIGEYILTWDEKGNLLSETSEASGRFFFYDSVPKEQWPALIEEVLQQGSL
jgi:hypothetical protein